MACMLIIKKKPTLFLEQYLKYLKKKMEQGHIIETGTHEELLAKGGSYYKLYMTQFAGSAT